jgi:magnesium chelatase subunit I
MVGARGGGGDEACEVAGLGTTFATPVSIFQQHIRFVSSTEHFVPANRYAPLIRRNALVTMYTFVPGVQSVRLVDSSHVVDMASVNPARDSVIEFTARRTYNHVMMKARTLGELKRSNYRRVSVKDEMRANLIRKLQAREPIFPGIIGFDDTVIPQIANAILSKHNFILLGLRGQAKSRILRSLVGLLDEEIPVIAGCEINDDPLAPLCRACHEKLKECGDATPIDYLPRDRRYVEKLATPDVTIADIIGDLDPIKAARGGHALSSELTIHYGLLPRANRGIFAINELPDLAGKIQVGLFNIMQEGDVQIKGYPVRLALDVVMVFTANPEDYTARGKIITPLKDRLGSEIRTHYPTTLEHALEITAQEAWTDRGGDGRLVIPQFVREIIETIAFEARQEKKIDKRSGVSQRMPITCLENVVSNAERRALLNQETLAVARVADVYAALPSLTGKFELEYEGELKGADQVAREIIRQATARIFKKYFDGVPMHGIVQWFEAGGNLKYADGAPAEEIFSQLKKVQGLVEKVQPLGIKPKDAVPLVVAGAEFILEGLYALKRISRNEELGYHAERRKVESTPAEEPTIPGPRRRPLN